MRGQPGGLPGLETGKLPARSGDGKWFCMAGVQCALGKQVWGQMFEGFVCKGVKFYLGGDREALKSFSIKVLNVLMI